MNRIRLIATIAPLAIVLLLGTVSVAYADPGIAERFNNGIKEVLWVIVVNVFGFFAAVGGNIFDFAVNQFVLNYGDTYSNTGVGQAIDTLWIYIRDFFNLLFIFGLVWLGLQMILNTTSTNTKQWLATLIIAALLVNFSLYITKFVVDFSNIIAVNILNAGVSAGTFPAPGADGYLPGSDVSISGSFLDILGLSSIFTIDGTRDATSEALVLSNGGYAYIFGTAIFLIITAFVFAAGGLLLIIRFVVLSLYMVFSPFMFIGWVLPQFASTQRKYWSGFLNRAFYAPIYIFLVWLSYFVMARYFTEEVDRGDQNFGNFLNEGGTAFQRGFGDTLIPFVLCCILLVASIIVAQKLSIDGGGQAVKMWGRYRRQIPRMLYYGGTLGGGYYANQKARQASFATGQGIRSRMNNLQRIDPTDREKYNTPGKRLGARMARAVSRTTTADRMARGAATKLEEQKFDLANTEAEDRRQKGAIVSRAERANAEDRGVAARDELQALESNPTAPINKTGRIYDPDNGVMVDRSSMSDDDIKKLLEKNRAKLQTTVAGYTAKEVEAMAQQEPKRFKAIAGELKPGQFEKGIIDSELIDAETKNDLRTARQTAIQDSLKVNGEVMTDRLQSLNKQQMTELSDQFIAENAADFKQSQIDDYLKDDDIVQSQKDSLTKSRRDEQVNRARAPHGVAQAKPFNNTTYDRASGRVVPAVSPNAKRKKAEEVAQIPFDAYKDSSGNFEPNMVEQLTGADLEKIFEKKTMTPQQRRELATAIRNSTSARAQDARDYLQSAQGIRNWS